MSNYKYVVVHRRDINNVGDMASNPLQYFLKPDEYKVVDIDYIYNTDYPGDIPLIVGGGGLIANENFGDSLRNVLNPADKNQLLNLWNYRWNLSNPVNKDLHESFISEYSKLLKSYIDRIDTNGPPKILWGAGHNGDVNKKNKLELNYPSWMVEFNLAGVRDWGQSVEWAPCASCMHPALRKEYSIKNDVIWFEHKKQLIKDFGNDSIPRFVNSGSNIEQTIEILGSANIILTNSYHGAYWGTLLKKKVVVVGAWSTKFYTFKHPPYVLEKNETWKEGVEKAMVHRHALSECIDKTEQFWNKVKLLK